MHKREISTKKRDRVILKVPLPVSVVLVVFAGIAVLYLSSFYSWEAGLERADRQLLVMANTHRSAWLDGLMEKVGSFYFWIPFYCAVVLFVLASDRVRFARAGIFLIVLLLLQIMVILLLNSQLEHLRPLYQRPIAMLLEVGRAGRGSAYGCLPLPSIAVGASAFLMMYLPRSYRPLKAVLVVWCALLLYNRMYNGWNYPEEVFASAAIALGISYLFFRLYRFQLGRYYAG
ncbi:phosphatase PAP2 family protein [Pedobacter sp. Du54]|uniref:phosphatase PAP2 family protein n=1 Tax=Pedobacter anseongensis TaxID=3133439 RepID=UPI0030ABC23B